MDFGSNIDFMEDDAKPKKESGPPKPKVQPADSFGSGLTEDSKVKPKPKKNKNLNKANNKI